MSAFGRFMTKPIPLYQAVISAIILAEVAVIVYDYVLESRVVEIVPEEPMMVLQTLDNIEEQLEEIEDILEDLDEDVEVYIPPEEFDPEIVERGRLIVEGYNSGVPYEELGLVNVAHNVFTDSEVLDETQDDGWNYATEIAKRTDDAPFIIHRDEFGEIEGQETAHLIWYEGDGVLADDKNILINDVDNTIGTNTLRWGYGSGDSTLVFIRNPFLEMDFEVSRNDGEFSAVYGILHGRDLWVNEHYRVKKHRVYDE